MNNNLKFKNVTSTFQVKADDEKGTFEAYGNAFGNVDHAGDKTMFGAFKKCIEDWKSKGEYPQFLSQHGHSKNPIGIITDLKEDENGLWFKGEFCLETQDGREAYALVKMGALKRFSIGYKTIKEKSVNGINELHELDVKEISLVTFACNEDSLLQSVKSAVDNGENPMRLIQKFMQEQGLSKRQASAAINAIKDEAKIESKRTLEIETIKEKVKSRKVKVHDVELDGTKSEMSMNEYISMVCCAVTDSISAKYKEDDDVYIYCEDLYTDFIVMCIYDYREDSCCKDFVKVPYSVQSGDNVLVGSPVSVTRLVKWVTEEEKEAMISEKLDDEIVDKEKNLDEEDDSLESEKSEEENEQPVEDVTVEDVKSWFASGGSTT